MYIKLIVIIRFKISKPARIRGFFLEEYSSLFLKIRIIANISPKTRIMIPNILLIISLIIAFKKPNTCPPFTKEYIEKKQS